MWKVRMRVVEDNPEWDAGLDEGDVGTNAGGILVYLQDDSGPEREVSRVLFVRRNSSNKTKSFKAQLREVLDVAGEAARAMNEGEREAAGEYGETAASLGREVEQIVAALQRAAGQVEAVRLGLEESRERAVPELAERT